MIAARAPLDLIAMASRFPLDEVVHVELCARLVGELGGAMRLIHDPLHIIVEPDREAPALLQAAELVVRNFCIGEAVSIPLLRASWHAAKHPLIRQVLGLIVKDEAAHGQFGWLFLDWAADRLDAAALKRLAAVARETILALLDNWKSVADRPGRFAQAEALGWLETGSYTELAHRSLRTHVISPLIERGIDPGPLA